jgi:hypothetical protein
MGFIEGVCCLKSKGILSGVLSFLLMTCILIFQFSLSIRLNGENPEFYLKLFERYGLYDDIQRYLSNELAGIVSDKNISQKLSQGVITSDWVKGEFVKFTPGMIQYLKGETNGIPVIDYTPVQERFVENFSSLVKEMGIISFIRNPMIESVKKNMTSAVTRLPFSSTWDKEEKSKFMDSTMVLRRIVPGVQYAVYISLGIGFLCFALLMHVGKGSRAFRFMGISLIIYSLLTLIPSILVLIAAKLKAPIVIPVLIPATSADLLSAIPSLAPVITGIIQGILFPVVLGSCINGILGLLLKKDLSAK